MAQGRMTKPVPLKRNAGMLECPVCKMPLRVERVMEKLERLAPEGDGQVSLDCESCKANRAMPTSVGWQKPEGPGLPPA